MKRLCSAYGRNLETNVTPDEVVELMEAVRKSGSVSKPYRVSLNPTENWGDCETMFDKDGKAQGHDITLSVLNDELLLHELAHAATNEEYGYHYMKDRRPHGTEFQRNLFRLTNTYERATK